ncbi:MAG: hypothetical protein JXL85_00445 [Bacilli bacterium]|nr:hypothetical protein [Bacilli bacterium]
MKKLFLLLFTLVLSVVLIGCNTGGSEIEVDLDEFIAAPENLEINGEVLSWDAVENANGYIVFGNGEELDDVKGTSYDFSDMTEERVIFQVQTKAPRGMQDSPLSASIAYVANKAAEIAEIVSIMEENNMNLPTGFAEELVNKGMLGSEVESMMTEFDSFMFDFENEDDLEVLYEALNDLLAEVDNVEALVSAIVKTLLVEGIQEMITDLEDQIEYYEDMIQYDPYSGYYQSRIDELQMTLDMYEEMLNEIETDPEAIVMAITSTVEYFISIEEMMTQDLIDSIVSISEAQDVSDLSASELNLVKEEMVNILRETMPSQEDMVLIFEVYDVLLMATGEVIAIENNVENYTGKIAIQALYTIEAYINFLDTFDQQYFEDVLAFLDTDDSMELAMAEVFILTVKYFRDFKNDNQALIDSISEVFTEAEQETLFDDYVQALNNADLDGETVSIPAEITFEQILLLQTVFEDAFDEFLDAFVASDGEVVRLAAIMSGFDYDYWEETYSNYVLGVDYDTSTEYYHNQDLYTILIGGEVVKLMNAVVQSLDAEGYEAFLDFIVTIVIGNMGTVTSMSEEYSMDLGPVGDAFDVFLADSAADQLELIQKLAEFAVDEDVFGQIYDARVDIYDYFVSEYGENYTYESEYFYDDYEEYYMAIFVANLYDDFMTSGNRGLVDDILAAGFDAVAVQDVLDLIGIDLADLNIVEDNLDDLLDYIGDGVDDIKGFNPDNLDDNDKTEIDDFLEGLLNLVSSITIQK